MSRIRTDAGVAEGVGVAEAVGVPDGVGVGVAPPEPFGVTEKSSTARPSSAPPASKSIQRIKNVAPFGMFNDEIVAEMAVRSGAELPSLAPAVPAVSGVVKSSGFTSV